MLHNALIALALAFSDDQFREIGVRERYASTAKSFIESESRTPSLSGVHGLSVLGSYHNSKGDQTLGYTYYGLASSLFE